MQLPVWILIAASVAEVLFLLVLFWIFKRLRRSEAVLNDLQANQERLLARLDLNTQLEQELMHSFAERQNQLHTLDAHLEKRVESLRKLLAEAEGISRSPQLLREIVISGYKAGRSKAELAKSTNLTMDEISLLLTKSGFSEK